jgi:hypothetical protein
VLCGRKEALRPTTQWRTLGSQITSQPELTRSSPARWSGATFWHQPCPLYPRKRTCAVQLSRCLLCANSGHRNKLSCRLFDDRVCAGNQARGHDDIEGFRRFEIDCKFKFF